MRSRRVPVLRLGSRGPGGDARSLRLCPPSVRKRLQASASVGECRASSGIANRRETQNCRHFLRLAFQKCQQSQGSGGSWSRNADLSSLLARLGSSRLKSVNSHRDRGGCGRETQICRHFWTRLGSSCLKTVNSHRDRGGGLWLRNADLSSLLDSSRVFVSQKCQQSQGSGGRGRETQICRHFWTRLWREERCEERGEKRDERRREKRGEKRREEESG